MIRILFLLSFTIVLSACSSSSDHQDLIEFMAQAKNIPGGVVEPPPRFDPYEPFVYSAAALRSPFDPPINEATLVLTGRKSNVQPNFDRAKEALEFIDLNSLVMVGTLERDNTLWALVDDNVGGIHRVKTGNYLGKNHGKIVTAAKDKVEVIEIVSDGRDGWLERPKTIYLAGAKD